MAGIVDFRSALPRVLQGERDGIRRRSRPHPSSCECPALLAPRSPSWIVRDVGQKLPNPNESLHCALRTGHRALLGRLQHLRDRTVREQLGHHRRPDPEAHGAQEASRAGSLV
eukprot:scaffold3038_cov250-Pinguiococcus_pyrenoidosus.AAC.7